MLSINNAYGQLYLSYNWNLYIKLIFNKFMLWMTIICNINCAIGHLPWAIIITLFLVNIHWRHYIEKWLQLSSSTLLILHRSTGGLPQPVCIQATLQINAGWIITGTNFQIHKKMDCRKNRQISHDGLSWQWNVPSQT